MISNHEWQPDENLVKTISDEIKGKYKTIPEGYESFIDDCAKIGAFLQDEYMLIQQLDRLNKLLEIEAEKQGLDTTSHKPFGYLQHKKVLRNVLENELSKIGFNPGLGKATGFLKQDSFLSAVKDGILLKDPGVIPQHGEFNHAIQWLLIGWTQNDTNFLSRPVIEIFKQIGDERSVFPNPVGEEKTIWDIVVDLPWYKAVKDEGGYIDRSSWNCRSPEQLNHQILSSGSDFPLLTTLCQERKTKRALNLHGQATHTEYETSNDPSLLLPKHKK